MRRPARAHAYAVSCAPSPPPARQCAAFSIARCVLLGQPQPLAAPVSSTRPANTSSPRTLPAARSGFHSPSEASLLHRSVMPRRAAAAAAPAGADTGPAAGAGSSGSLPLPPDLLAAVLRHLPVSERLRRAALVGRAWAAAAVAATTAVCATQAYPNEQRAALDRWLAAHSAQLVSLRVAHSYHSRPLALPPPRDLAALESLQLEHCVIPYNPKELSALTRLSALQLINASDALNNMAGVVAMLHALPQLQSLELGDDALGADGPAAAVASVVASRLTQLQRLRLGGSFLGIDAAVLAGLPLGLTRLALTGPPRYGFFAQRQYAAIGGTTCPRLGELTVLRDLELAAVRLEEPGMFSGLSGLTRFVLRGYESLPDQGYTPAEAASTAKGTPALLRLLGQQTGLQHLDIEDALQHPLGPYGLWAQFEEEQGGSFSAYAAEPDEAPLGGGNNGDEAQPRPYLLPLYSGLVHTTLTRLCISDYSSGCLLPKAAGRVMFGGRGLRLPHLRSLTLQGQDDADCGGYPNSYITPADLRCIAECCLGGALHDLNLLGAVESGADYACLKRLTCLTGLTIGGANTTGVAQLTRLRSLSITHAAFYDVDLVDVAKHLTQLTHLYLDNVDCADEIGWTYDKHGKCTAFEHHPGSDDEDYSTPVGEHVRRAFEGAGKWARLCAELEARQLRQALLAAQAGA